MKGFIKKFIDIALLMLFFSGLASMFLPADLHEILGCAFIVLVIIHNFLNRNFYRSIPKGAITRSRLLNCICMFFFSMSLGVLIFSGVALSNYVFADLKIPDILNWRAVHLAAAIATLFVLFVHLLIYAKRYIKSKALRIASGILFVIAVSSIFAMPYLDRWYHKVEIDSTQIVHGKQLNNFGKVITIYFSRVGNTDFPADVDAVSGASVMKDKEEIIGNAQMIAAMSQNIVGGELFEIQTVKKYPASYSETTNVAKQEFSSDEQIELKPQDINFANYDRIILIYPLWWSTLPKPVETFIKSYDLGGKMMIPIVTHGGGGVGDSVDVLRRITKANVKDPLDIYSSDIPTSRKNIYNYLEAMK